METFLPMAAFNFTFARTLRHSYIITGGGGSRGEGPLPPVILCIAVMEKNYVQTQNRLSIRFCVISSYFLSVYAYRTRPI